MKSSALLALVVVLSGTASCKMRDYNKANPKDASDPAHFILKEGQASFFKKEPKDASALGEYDVCNLKQGKKYTYDGQATLTQPSVS